MPQTWNATSGGAPSRQLRRGIEIRLHKGKTKNKIILKNSHRGRDRYKGLLHSRPTNHTERKETTQLKQNRHLYKPYRRRGSQATPLWDLARQKRGKEGRQGVLPLDGVRLAWRSGPAFPDGKSSNSPGRCRHRGQNRGPPP